MFKFKKNNYIFVCQITDTSVKVAKFLFSHGTRRSLSGFKVEQLGSEPTDPAISDKLIQIFKALGYKSEPIQISFPRSFVTLRFLKVPAKDDREIERIISLQAPRFLPYPPNELNTGFEVIKTDHNGYSYVNMVIAHRKSVDRYMGYFQALKPSKLSLLMSSYGIWGLYSHLCPGQDKVVMLLDLDSNSAEILIAGESRLFFSRAFKFTKTNPGWKKIIAEELIKTRDAYLKEIGSDAPVALVVLGTQEPGDNLVQELKESINIPVSFLDYSKNIDFVEKIAVGGFSLASILGLGFSVLPQSLNLLSCEAKEASRSLHKRKELLKLAGSVFFIVLLLVLGLLKNIANKTDYLKALKSDLAKISQESRKLEDLEKRFKLFENYSKVSVPTVDLLYELHRLIPEQVSLVSFNYEKDSGLTLHGMTPELNNVFSFVSALQKSHIFKNFTVKIKYATKKTLKSGEAVDFEIVCLKGS